MKTDNAVSIELMLVAIYAGALFGIPIGGVAYACLSVSFLRPFAFAVLALVALGLAVVISILCLGIWERIHTRSRPVRNGMDCNKAEVNPSIILQIQAQSKVKSIVDKHFETLARRRLMLVTVDHYGVVDGSGWNKEVQRFVDKVVRPALSESEANAIAPNMNAIFQDIIEDRVRLRSDQIEAQLEFSETFTPRQFEQWCTNTLSALGWNAITTKASGDQGADVVAHKDGTRIVLQCKLYSGTVGNKAVQEAYAAKRHYASNVAGVVSNAKFSQSARALAGTTGVLLLHYADLTQLDRLVSKKLLNHNLPDSSVPGLSPES